jgi:hypothetical protein
MRRPKQRGAKPLPKGEAKSRVLLVRMRPADYDAMLQAAQARGQKVSAWARAALLREARL